MINNIKYQEELDKVLKDKNIDFKKFQDKTIMITGATGLIGSFLVDTIMYGNKKYNMNIKIIVNSRSLDKITKRFKDYIEDKNFKILIQDVNQNISYNDKVDYIIHAASNAYPKLFKEDPVGTMLSNFLGLKNILDYAKTNKVTRVLYVSSGEIYGETEKKNSLKENDYGYVDILSSRSCYPEAKRASETLAISYSEEYNLDVVIVRPCHTFGPTATIDDNRVSSSFMRDALKGYDIVLKSKGEQVRSYCYITDSIKALLLVLDKGIKGEAYNLSNPNSIATIKELGLTIANYTGVKVLFDIPKNTPQNFNKMEMAVLDSSKLIKLGFKPLYNFQDAIKNNLDILKEEIV